MKRIINNSTEKNSERIYLRTLSTEAMMSTRGGTVQVIPLPDVD